MAKTHEIHVISSGAGGFVPEFITIEPGDSIVWVNETAAAHTATAFPGQSVFFDTGDIPPDITSDPILFDKATGQSGCDYHCHHHPVMEGHIVVQDAKLRDLRLLSEAQDLTQGLQTFPRVAWQRMAHIICAMWVLDMADDFTASASVHRPEDNASVKQAYADIEAFWRQLIGDPSARIADQSSLLAQSRERLEVLGRKLRVAYFKLRPLVFRSPFPGRPDDQGGGDILYPGQSNDPFGKAITVNHTNFIIRTIEPLEESMAGPAFRIERAMDLGEEAPAATMQAYQTAKGLILPEHYQVLADHQFQGLTRLFGNTQFDEGQFLSGISRMTRRGEWDGPAFVGWHWMRWIQMYLETLDTGVVPDMFRPMPSV